MNALMADVSRSGMECCHGFGGGSGSTTCVNNDAITAYKEI